MIEINYNYKQTTDYLIEKSLGDFLKSFLPNIKIYHDKIVPMSNIKNRPDYRIDELKLILEFNGYHHYTNPITILNDHKKTQIYEGMGYTVRSIPYWMQLRSDVIFNIFKDKINIDIYKLKDYNLYPIGFHDKKCMLPSSFCYLGLLRLMKEREYWDKIIDKLYKYFDFSLIDKILEKDSFLKVANNIVLPYFVTQWKNKCISSYSINYNNFEGINKEINNRLYK